MSKRQKCKVVEQVEIMSYESAKKYVQSLGLKSMKEVFLFGFGRMEAVNEFRSLRKKKMKADDAFKVVKEKYEPIAIAEGRIIEAKKWRMKGETEWSQSRANRKKGNFRCIKVEQKSFTKK